MDKVGVYCISSPSGKRYIGMTTVSFSARWNTHKKKLRYNTHENKALQRAANKYGVNALVFSTLEVWSPGADVNLIQLREVYWWSLYSQKGPLYNSRPSGNGSVVHSDETRLQISQSNKAAAMKRGTIYWSQTCKSCFQTFETPTSENTRKYCPDCRDAGARRAVNRQIELICEYCSENFSTKYKSQRFCSRSCSSKRQVKFSAEEVKELLSQGVKPSEIAKALKCSRTTVYKIKNMAL